MPQKCMFTYGDDDKISFIQDLDFPGPREKKLYLGNRITTKFFGAGVFLTDHGYVLGVRSLIPQDSEFYYQLDDQKVQALQAEGFLPNPMPEYKIGIVDYLIRRLSR